MPYTQVDRPLVVSTSLGDDAFVVTGMRGTEELSRPFHFSLDLVSDRPRIDAAALLGKPALLAIAGMGGTERLIHGIVNRFRRVGAGTALTSYQLELVAWPWMLSLSTDCRIFQKLTVPEIVTAVFKDLGFNDFRLRLVNSHPPREFCVQYRETHLDFVTRLLEDEGIFYFFEHEEEHHWLVLTDSSSILKPCPGTPTLKPAPAALARSVGNQYTGLVAERAVQTRAVALADYNYLKPSAALGVSLEATAGAGEWFDYPGGYDAVAEGDRLAKLLLETMDAEREAVRGTSNAPTLISGFTVQLPDTATASGGNSWIIVSVQHTARPPAPVAGSTGNDEGFTFESAFTLAAADLPWRPPRDSLRPHVYGTQSALVVGPSGEEIYTDAHGRVKLHFYWDRYSKRDENSSCWIRCSSAWAGQGYGQFSVPRMGQEVLVDFLEGDPDRPVVVGRVYNGEQPPPCDPGGSRGVVSGMRSKTHKGSGYNEMSMDDSKGKEKISIHAQYDMFTVVEHDDTQTVKNHRTISITQGNLTQDVVAGTATYHVKGAVAETFEATQATTVKSDITIVSQTGGIAIAADAQHVYIKGTTSIQLHVGASTIWMDAGGQISIDGVNVTINGSSSVTIKGGTVHSEAQSEHQTKGAIVLSEGSATNTVKGGMVMLNP